MTLHIVELLATLKKQGAHIALEGDELVLKGQRSLFTPEVIAQIKEQKPFILNLLRGSTQPPIPRLTDRGVAPLSFAQQRLWFLDQLEPNSAFYNCPMALRLIGKLDIDAFAQALNEVVRRHEVLRMHVETPAEVPVQVFAPQLTLPLPCTDLSMLPEAEREQEAERLADAEAVRPFNLATGPLIRATLLRLRETEHVILLTLHHIVTDGWSDTVLIHEMGVLYDAFAQHLPSPLPELPVQYGDFAHWQHQQLTEDALKKEAEYWKQQLAGAPALLDLPTDRPRPAVQTYNGSSVGFMIADTKGLNALTQQAHATLFMTFTAIFSVLLARYSGNNDICIGTPVANRNRPEIEPLIGFFVNTLVMRARLEGDPTFNELLAQVRATALQAYQHQDIPFEQLVNVLKPERSLSHAPLYQVALTLQTAPSVSETESTDLSIEPFATESKTTKSDLMLDISESGDQLFGNFNYNTDLFDRLTIERMIRHFRQLIDAIVADPGSKISALPLLSPRERQQQLVDWNDTNLADPQPEVIHSLFEKDAEKAPDATALVFEEQRLAYAQLNAQSNQLAHYLRSLNVGPDVLVALCLKRSAEMVVALLGILKAGGAYLPLDPSYPKERLAYMLNDARPQVLITETPLLENLPAHESRWICLDTLSKELAQQSQENPPNHTLPAHLAYVIYTSGSTGRPKGTLLSHQGLGNLVRAQTRHFGIEPRDRLLQFASLNFDASVSEIFVALARGACLCLASTDHLMPGRDLNSTLKRLDITVVTLPPSATEGLDAPSLRTLVVAGEACPPGMVRKLATGRRLINAYGPTETTVCASIYRCTGNEPGAPPIGRPISNTQLYILDINLMPQPIGVPGELYIAGTGLARGYLNRPDLTAARFIPNPFGTPGARMYKTGDRARYLEDGNIEYIGRVDHQVKVRGFRIELGEIEAALTQLEGVQEAAAVPREDQPGNQRLVAYVVFSPEAKGNVAAIRAGLSRLLPEYMMPSQFVVLKTLPLMPNGKLNRNALPSPDSARPDWLTTTYLPPRNEAERTIADIWKELLQVEQAGMDDNFFDLGGHSQLAMQLHRRLMTAFAKDFPLSELFRHTTIAAQAQYLVTVAGESPKESSTPAPAQRPRAGERDIAIIGLVGRFPEADDLEQFWQNLRNGVESVALLSDEQLRESGLDPGLLVDPNYVKRIVIPPSDFDRFDARFFGLNPREAETMDPQQRLFLEAAWHALEHAGYDPYRYNGRIGVYAGQSISSYFFQNLLPHFGEAGMPSESQVSLGNDKDYLATQVAYRLNLKGPALSVQTACSTSLVAVHLACQSLLNKECDMALAGGVSLAPAAGYLYDSGSILSPDGHCRAFDAQAQGTTDGKGLGIVVLKRLSDALADGDTIHAMIKGSAINNDGANKIGYTAPSEDGQIEVIRAALATAGISPRDISYVEAHGTGTPLGDPIEANALNRVFRGRAPRSCALGSVKSNIGHLDAAAGVAGLIKTVLALEHREVPPTLNVTTPTPKIDWENSPIFVNTELRAWETEEHRPRRAGVSSFGIGGTNAHVVLEEAPELPPTGSARGEQLLVLSARTSEALEVATNKLANYLREHPHVNLADVAYTLQVGRHAFSHRRALVCRDTTDAVVALAGDERRLLRAIETPRHPTLVFMFPGQGAQYAGMGRDLYDSEPVFREAVDGCARLLEPYLGFSLLEVLYPPHEEEASANARLQQTGLTQPALFATEYALAQLWQAWGIKPQALIGHSIGEYVTACIAGVFSLEDAITLVAKRAALIQSLPTGAMLSVALPEAEVEAYLNEEVALAAVNGPKLCVLSGPVPAIDALRAELQQRGIDGRRLHTSHAFHSPMIEPVLATFTAIAEEISYGAPRIPFVSNVTGTWITTQQATDPEYWAKHLRQTVRFADGLKVLLAKEHSVLLEIGPGRTLCTFAIQQKAPAAFGSLRHAQDPQTDLPFTLTTLARLWLSGVGVDWHGFHGQERRRRVPLPTYPFARERYWIESNATRTDDEHLSSERKPDIADWFYVPSWKQSALVDPPELNSDTKSSVCWLVFLSEGSFGIELLERLRQTDVRVTVVVVGDHFHRMDDDRYTIDPRQPDHYRRLLDELRERNQFPQTIVHLWSITAEHLPPGLRRLNTVQARGFDSLIFLAQALEPTDSVHIAVVSFGTQRVIGNERLYPENSLVLGPCRVIPREYENVTCRCIDIVLPKSGTSEEQELAGSLLGELMTNVPDTLIAYRNTLRWIQVWEPVRLNPSQRKLPRLRRGGVYVITGGLGGIGLVLAEHLARTVQAKLVLIARSPLPNRADWTQWLRTAAPADRVRTKIEKLQTLEALGSEVLPLIADVTDSEQMRAALTSARECFGTIHGVIHAAGVAGGGIIQLKTPEAAGLVLDPKVKGAFVLGECLRGNTLDFMVLCSSLASLLQIPGQADYCAANAFLDAYAHYQRANRGPFTVAINWDEWQEVGMAVDTPTPRGFETLETSTPHGLRPNEGVEVFECVLNHDLCQVAVSTVDLQALKERHAAPFGALEPAGASMPMHARPALENVYISPRNDSERKIAEIWQEVLGIERVGIHDDFFALGGHSLLAIQVLSKIRVVFGVDMAIGVIFEAPDIETLARRLESVSAEQATNAFVPPISPTDRTQPLPLSYAQESFWIKAPELPPDDPAFNCHNANRISGPLDISALERALNEIVRRHEILRTAIRTTESGIFQVIAPAMTISLPVVDLSRFTPTEREARALELVHAEAVRRFDLSTGSLLSVGVIRLDEDEHIIQFNMHHTATDGWSYQILMSELWQLYTAFAQGKPSSLSAPVIQYADFAVWQRQWLTGEVLEREISFWKAQLAGVPAFLTLPTDRPHPPTQTSAGAAIDFVLPAATYAGLQALSKQADATLFMTLAAAFGVLLSRYSGQTDFCLGTVAANRNRIETEKLIGCFIHEMVLRTKVDPHASFLTFLRDVRKTTLSVLAREYFPFKLLLSTLGIARNPSYPPLFQVMFILQTSGAADQADTAPDGDQSLLVIQSVECATRHCEYSLYLNMAEDANQLSGSFIYNTDLFDHNTVDRMHKSFAGLINAIVTNPATAIVDLPLSEAPTEMHA